MVFNETKLIRTLATLTPIEWSDFKKFLLIHTRRDSDNYEFFDFLHIRRARIPNMEDGDGIRKKHFGHLTSKGFSNLMSRIYNWLEEWLMISEFKKEKYLPEVYLLKSLNRRGLYKDANAIYSSIEEKILCNDKIDLDNNKYLAELYHSQYYSNNPIKFKSGSKTIENLIESYLLSIQEHLSIYIAEGYNISRIQNYNLDKVVDLCQKVISVIPNSKARNSLSLIEKVIHLNDAEALYQLYEDVKTGKYVTPSFIHTLITYYLIASSLQQWIKGKIKSFDIISEIYEYALDSDVLLIGDKVSFVSFQNMITVLSSYKEYEWTNSFIDRHYEKVEAEFSSDIKYISIALNALKHDKYDDILENVLKIKGSEFDLKMKSYCLHAIALYKDKSVDLDIMAYKLSNFKKFLKRHKGKFSEKLFWSYYNLIEIISILSQRSYKNIEIDLSKYEYLTYRSWVKNEIKKAK